MVGGAAGCRAVPEWPRLPGSSARQQADAVYAAGDYGQASDLYRQHLEGRPNGRGNDRVLFRLATIHLSPESPVYDVRAGEGFLDRLIEDHPESSLTEPARLLRDLQSRIDALEQQDQEQRKRLADLAERLEALKRIDLERSQEPPPR